MSWVLSVHPDATAEARAARLWYLERSPQAAELFVADLEHDTIRLLAVQHGRRRPGYWKART
jgi:hypothetical protein